MKFLRGGVGGGSGAADPTVIQVPTGAPSIPSDYIGQLGTLADWIRQQVSKQNESLEDIGETIEDIQGKLTPGNPITPPAPKPTSPPVTAKPVATGLQSGFGLANYVIGLRRRFPDLAKRFGEKEYAGESASQRTARLMRELKHYGTSGLTDQLGTYIRGLRARYPSIAKGFSERERAGETAAQRQARLTRELAFFRQRGVG
jgi:hypothetical protein